MEGLFLDGDKLEEGNDDGSDEGFHMASLSFEDTDDDDEDHEDDSLVHKSALTSAAIANKNKPNKKTGAKLLRRNTSSSPSPPQPTRLLPQPLANTSSQPTNSLCGKNGPAGLPIRYTTQSSLSSPTP